MKGVTGVILAAIFVLVVAIGAAVYVAYGESFTGLFWQDSSPEAGGAVGEGAPGSGTPNGGDAAPFTGRLVEKDNGESSDDGSGAEPEAPPQDSQADDQGEDDQGSGSSSRGSSPPSCPDECSNAGSTRCSGNIEQTCGNYDADPCIEWGVDKDCPYGCSDEKCGQSPGDEQ